MKVEFTPVTDALLPACRAFNERLRRHGEPPFTLAEDAQPGCAPAPGGIAWTRFAAVDETGAVRGGVVLMEQRGWLAGREVPLINVQSPLSEGTVDRKFAGVGLQMLKFLAGRGEFVYAVGMGSEQNPFARLLKAAGWRVGLVPFQFSVVRAGRFLREIGPLQAGNRRLAARFAAATGLGAAALSGWRAVHWRPGARGYSLDAAGFKPGEADRVWHCCREALSFSAARDAAAVAGLYPEPDARLRRFVLRRGGEAVGWSAGLVTPMRENAYFGNLTVGTILDALAPEELLEALVARTRDALADLGADLIVLNCTHASWRNALRRIGFLSGPSNYVLAVSKPLAAALDREPGGFERAYVTRADGDGRLNL